jgi:hypothetical protein
MSLFASESMWESAYLLLACKLSLLNTSQNRTQICRHTYPIVNRNKQKKRKKEKENNNKMNKNKEMSEVD